MRARRAPPVRRPRFQAGSRGVALFARQERRRQNQPAAHADRPAAAGSRRNPLEGPVDPIRRFPRRPLLPRPPECHQGRTDPAGKPARRRPAGRRGALRGRRHRRAGAGRPGRPRGSGLQVPVARPEAPRRAGPPRQGKASAVGARRALCRARRRRRRLAGRHHLRSPATRRPGRDDHPPACRRPGRHRSRTASVLMFKIITAVIGRDLKLAMRRQADIVSAVFFFIIVVSLFPLGIGPEPDLLRKLAPGVLWVAALLATMLSLPRLFADDHRDGTLEQLALAPHPLGLVVTGKVIAHWLVSGLPLALIAPVLGIQFDLSADALLVLTGAILLGTPALSGIGAIGAALTLGLRGGGVLLSLLVLPLYIPVLIFGAGAVDATVSGLGGEGHLSLLAAITFASVGFAPWATAAALKIALE